MDAGRRLLLTSADIRPNRYKTFSSEAPYLFVRVAPMTYANYRDPLVELDVHCLQQEEELIGLPEIDGGKIWMVPIVRGPGQLDMKLHPNPQKMKSGDEALFVEWDIQFL
jgi:hypothetical protein